MVAEQTVTVFFIGDDVAHRRLVHEALEGAQPVQLLGECGSIERALPLLEEVGPDMVIMDLTLSSIRDLRWAQEVRKRMPGCKLITLIHEEDELGMYRSIDAGAAACYPMDRPPEFLASIVRQVARGESPIHYTVLGNSHLALNLLRRLQEDSFRRPRPSPATPSPLSPRHLQILKLVARGCANKEIAETLHLSEQTVKNHVTAILRKLEGNDRTHAVTLALAHGWITLEYLRVALPACGMVPEHPG